MPGIHDLVNQSQDVDGRVSTRLDG